MKTFRVIDKRTGLPWNPTPDRRTGPRTRREKDRPLRGRRVEDLVPDLEVIAAWDEAFEVAPGSTI